MKIATKEFMKKVAMGGIGPVVAVGLGIYQMHVNVVPDHATIEQISKHSADIAKMGSEIFEKSFVGLAAGYTLYKATKKTAREQAAAAMITVTDDIRPPVANLGMFLSEREMVEQMFANHNELFVKYGSNHKIDHKRLYLYEFTKKIKMILESTTELRALTDKEKSDLNFSNGSDVYAKPDGIISMNTENQRDPVEASAGGGYLKTVADKDIPLCKNDSIRLGVLQGFYGDMNDAEKAWDGVYDERGKVLLQNALEVNLNFAGIIMDGPDALRRRENSIVMKFGERDNGECRWIGVKNVIGVQNFDDAYESIKIMNKQGIYDADEKKVMPMNLEKIQSLAKSLLDQIEMRKVIPGRLKTNYDKIINDHINRLVEQPQENVQKMPIADYSIQSLDGTPFKATQSSVSRIR